MSGTCIVIIFDISNIYLPIYLCTSCWCSRSSTFSQGIYPNTRVNYFWIFCIFLGHVLHLAYLFQTFRAFSPPIYLWKSGWCSRSSTFFPAIYSNTRLVSFPDIPGTCIVSILNILWHLVPQFICAHPADAPEVLHFPRTFTRASGQLFSDFPHISGTCITFSFGHFRHLAPQFICAHLADADVLHFPEQLPKHQGCFTQIFWTFLGHVFHLYMSMAYLIRIFQTFSHPIYLCRSS